MFWDASALVPTFIEEQSSPEMTALLNRDGDPAIWWSTPLECMSAIDRRRHDRILSTEESDQALVRLQEALERFWVMPATSELRDSAGQILATHRLRTGDALQLAAALLWSEGH